VSQVSWLLTKEMENISLKWNNWHCIWFGNLNYTTNFPVSIAVFLWTMIATWSIATGIVDINAALRLRKEIDNEVLLALNGILSVAIGIIVLMMVWANPSFNELGNARVAYRL
jgi:uncharacterized membrane protein HdeD (DUF308 family)